MSILDLVLTGPALYRGLAGSHTFFTGTFASTQVGDPGGRYDLTITDPGLACRRRCRSRRPGG